jgi:hypothetical protein
MKKCIFMCLFIFCELIANPPKEIPEELISDFTLNNTIPLSYYYFNSLRIPGKTPIYTKAIVDRFINRIKDKQHVGYPLLDPLIYRALDTKYKKLIEGKTVGIIGSRAPRYEALAIYYGAKPITVEYQKIISQDSRIRIFTVDEYNANPIKFDVIFSFSSIEHDGLGRYGDPINPNGDLETMNYYKSLLKDGGLFFLAVPVGRDAVVWNSHRTYGKIRLPMLLKGWKILDTYGFDDDLLDRPHYRQPLIILKK